MTAAPPRVLVAGIGNLFLGDDGFGVETVRRLAAQPLPPGTELADIGVRGVHLAYRMLDGYDTAVLVDAVPGDGPPGTVRLIEPATGPAAGQVAVDGHHMTPDAVLALLDHLAETTGGARPRRVLVVGCVPADLDEGIGLSAPVEAAVDAAVRLLTTLLSEATPTPPEPAGGPAART
ncbi:hydrogenase maturation protease [Streptomyces catenulae]|uniref:Hydrogenase maturation protease n=1 Tax=Streptomyces catenulae TaxID=66875 RepID=A0ABV2YS31_9ACTN|nr:hydrogenase maturation protease [Streptomyces catenulae]